MLREIRPAIVILVALTLITGLVYPLAITGIAQKLFPHQAQGSLIERNGAIVGSELIGQVFESDKYFHGRPSATTTPDPNDSTKTVPAPYNAANSGGSNLGPSNKALIDRVQGDIDSMQHRLEHLRSTSAMAELNAEFKKRREPGPVSAFFGAIGRGIGRLF